MGPQLCKRLQQGTHEIDVPWKSHRIRRSVIFSSAHEKVGLAAQGTWNRIAMCIQGKATKHDQTHRNNT